MSLSATMRERRKAIKEQLDALVASTESRDDKNFTPEETAKFDQLLAELRTADERILEIEEREAAEARSAAARVAAGESGEQRTGGAQVTDAPVYVPGGINGNSYFQDLGRRATNHSRAGEATDRLVRAHRQSVDEARAIGNTNATGGSGGELAPPQWLVNEWINLLRPGRVTADLFRKTPIPDGVSSVAIPKLTGGTSVAVQSTQNSTVTATDITTSFVSTGWTTILGKQVVSQQLLDQSAISLDEVISSDLASAYNAFYGSQLFIGAGTGANNNSVLNGLMNAPTIAANQATLAASPTGAQFYSKANGMLSNFVTNRFAPPTHWVMHPRRWFWLLSLTDSSGRPFVVPNDVAFNPLATNEGVASQGYAGRFLSLPVVIDPNVPTNQGAGTNQDVIFLLKSDDLWLYENAPRAESFTAPYAESMGVLFRLFSYAGAILNRLNTSIGTMNGAGLTPPAF